MTEASDDSAAAAEGEQNVANQLQIGNFTDSPQLTAKAANQGVLGRIYVIGSGGGKRKEEGMYVNGGEEARGTNSISHFL